MYEYKVEKILKIYDGDTITVRIDLGFGVFKIEKIRLSFIDTPEIRGEERPEGLISRDWLRAVLYQAEKENKDIIIKTIRDRKGKYGRYLAEIFIDGKSINKEMLEEGLAEPY
jgi:micrococcal nuclease